MSGVQESHSTYSKTTSQSVRVSQSSGISSKTDNFEGLDHFSFKPSLNTGPIHGLDSDFEDVSGQLQVARANDGEMLQVKLDVPEYKPKEIQVKVSGNYVVITGRHETKTSSSIRTSSFSKKFNIPQGVQADTITCSLTKNGGLVITAPVQPNTVSTAITARNQQQDETSISSSTNTKARQQCLESKTGQVNVSTSLERCEKIGTTEIADADEIIVRLRKVDLNFKVVKDKKTFVEQLEIKNFQVEEITVKVKQYLVRIEGKHESEFASRSFYKEFTMPSGVDAKTVQCTITSTGVLTIAAPIKQQPSTVHQGQDTTEKRSTAVSSVEQQVSTSTAHAHAQQHQHVQTSEQQVSSTTVQEQHKTSQQQHQVSTSNAAVQEQVKNSEQVRVAVQEQVRNSEQQVKNSEQVIQDKVNTSHQKVSNTPVPEVVKALEQPANTVVPKVVKTAEQQVIQEHVKTSDQNISAAVQQQVKTSEQQVSNVEKTQEVTSKEQQRQNTQETTNSDVQDSKSIKTATTELTVKEDATPNIVDGEWIETLEVTGYKAEEIDIKITKELVIVEGTVKTKFASRSFYEEYIIPDGVEPGTIKWTVSENVLTIRAKITTQKSTSRVQSSNKTNTSTTEQVQQVASVKEQQVTTSEQKSVQQMATSNQQKIRQETSESEIGLSDNHNSDSTRTQTQATAITCTSKTVDVDDKQDVLVKPVIDLDNTSSSTDFEDISKEMTLKNDGETFEMNLEVTGYKPDELQVKISKTTVIIQGKQESREENKFSSRQFYKMFTIPAGVNPENITSSLSSKGLLRITASISKECRSITSTLTSSTSDQSTCTAVNSSTDQEQDFVVLKSVRDSGNSSETDTRFEDISTQMLQLKDGNKYETTLDVSGYKPEELQVKISNNMVSICGRQEITEEFKSSSKSFYKRFSIPHGVSPDSICSRLSSRGILTISATIDEATATKTTITRTTTGGC